MSTVEKPSINKIDLNQLRNDAQFQFHTEFRALTEQTGAAAVKIEALWPEYLRLYVELDAALKKIVKSALTDKIKTADVDRDAAFSGFAKFLAAMCEHYDAAIRDAALKIEVVAHTYGNVAVKPLNEETSAIYNMVQELNSDNYRPLVTQTGLTQWVNKLTQKNNAFEALIQERDRESAAKSHVAVREARRALDEVYRYITEAVNSQLFFGQLTGCGAFVDTLNEIIHRFAKKHHHHKRGADAAETESAPQEVAEAV